MMHVCHKTRVYGFSTERHRGEAATYYKDDLMTLMLTESLLTRPSQHPKHSADAEHALLKAFAAEGYLTLCGARGCRTGSQLASDTVLSGN
jgi:hypothetical protein